MEVGGTELHVASIACALATRSWKVAVYSAADGPVTKLLQANNVKLILPPPARELFDKLPGSGIFRLAASALHLLSVLLKQRPQVVHFFLPGAYLVGSPLAIAARSRVRVMSRRSLNRYQNRSRLVAPFERWLHKHMTAVLGNSRSVMKELEAEGVNAGRLGLIYNGLDLDRVPSASREQVRATLGIPETSLVLVIVANLIPYKGHVDLVEALGQVADSMPAEWRLLIVGRDDDAGTAVRARAQSADIADKILFLGERNDVPDLLSASDIGLLTSHQEGFSNAILECMSAGLPMIVTDVGGNAEAVVDGQTGLVVPARNPVVLAAAIQRLSCDPQLRERYGEEGRRRATKYFGLDSCVAAYEALYRGLLSGKTPADIPEIQYRA